MLAFFRSVFMVVFLLFAFYLQLTVPVIAQSIVNIGSSKLDPSSPVYFLKAVRESLEIRLASSERVRILRRIEFAQRRLREVNSLIGQNREDLIPSNIEKFLLEVRLITPIEDESSNPTVSHALGNYMENLIELSKNASDPKAKLSISRGIYSLVSLNKAFYENLKPDLAISLASPQAAKLETGCRLLTKEASSSSFNASERQVLSQRGGRCSKIVATLYGNY